MLKTKKLKRFAIGALIALTTNGLHAQNQANNWAFGVNGGLSFNAAPPHAATPITTAMDQAEGVACMSDASGNLLFYTDGTRIWNGSHTLVVSSGLFGNYSATQSAIIVPDPASTTEYYIFTVGNFANADGLQYVKYSTSTEALVGTSTPLQTTVTEKITAVKKGDNSGYWVLAHDWGNNNFFVYEITCTGLTLSAIQSVGAPHQGHINSTLGYMKFNADGNRLAVANTYGNYGGGGIPSVAQSYGFVQVFDFDNITGVINTTGIVNIGLNAALTGDDGATLFTPYGLEFSENGNFLYISEVGRTSTPTAGKLHQYNFSTGSIVTIGSANGGTYDIGALQMGRDGKIYVAIDQRSYLGVINTPEIAIPASSINFGIAANQINLTAGSIVRLGLPNFIQSIFSDTEIAFSGSECNPTFSFTGSGDITSYNWNFGDGNTSTASNPTHTYNTPGTYTVTLTTTTAAGCTNVNTLSVTAEDCCPVASAATDVIYHSTNETITDIVNWSGTHYVEDGVIITVNPGATLDITNVDVIFGECAGIDFVGNSTARINNSVLRPCDMEKTWRGLNFKPSAIGLKPKATINESTFKNAQTGINYIGTLASQRSNLDMNITNNLFLNNQVGVALKDTRFDEHITGNTFNVENIKLFSSVDCPNPTSAINRQGISIWNVTARGTIAQNDFICTKNSNAINLYGVSTTSSSAFITENNFSNNYHAVYVRFGSNVKIENNEIGVSALHAQNRSQIYILSGNMVTIKGNQLTNTNNLDQRIVSGTQSAIKVVKGSKNIWIKENEIDGFETGINLNQSNEIVVAENTIENSWFYGIYMNASNGSGANMYISCNTINMYNVPNSDVTGIGFYQTGRTDHRVKIYSNCIFETNQAIHLENTSGTTNVMPEIRNNFMYNYTRAGIENINMIGNIGASGTDHSQAGRNSFISNNSPNQNATTTGDIISNVAITQNGNYGVGLFTANVTGNANAANYHSTASCGGQNRWGNNYSNEIDVAEICDNVKIYLREVLKTVGGKQELKSEAYSAINNIETAVLILSYLNEVNPDVLAYTHTKIKAEADLYEADLNQLDYAYFLLTQQYENAKSLANNIDDQTIVLKDIALIDYILNGIVWNDMPEEEKAEILAHDATIIAPSHLQNVETFTTNQFELNIYPSPSKGDLTIQLNSAAENPVVKIYDIHGKLLETENLTTRNTLLHLNVSHLSNGIYVVVLENDGITTQGKFIKN